MEAACCMRWDSTMMKMAKREEATTALGTAVAQWTEEQRQLIKKTCFPDSTDDELAMYLHVAKRSGLDPLSRQLHPLRLQGRLNFVADVNGLQARAAREPDYEGLTHAVVYEKDDFQVDNTQGVVVRHTHNPFGSGKIVGAWATVHRKGMRPFTVVVRIEEYVSPRNPLWREKPAVMMDKVAKSTALRLAYPEQLGGIYERAELDKAAPNPAKGLPAETAAGIVDGQVVASPPAPEPAHVTSQVASQVAPPPAPAAQAPLEPLVQSPPPMEIRTMLFGPMKGRGVSTLSMEELSAAIDFANDSLTNNPTAGWVSKMKRNQAWLEDEMSKRLKEVAPAR